MPTLEVTTPPPRKRVRITETDSEIVPLESDEMHPIAAAAKTPTGAAKATIFRTVRSLPMQIQSFIIPLALDFNRLKSKERQQLQTKQRLMDDSFIPRSTRIEFELKASTNVMETDEFKTLRAQSIVNNSEFQNKQKKVMTDTLELEIKDTKRQQLETFFKLATNLGFLSYLHANPYCEISEIPKNKIARAAFDSTPAETWKHLPTTAGTVFNSFKTFAEDNVEYTPGTQLPENEGLREIITNLALILPKIFTNSWEAQLLTLYMREQDTKLSKQVRHLQVGTSTEETAMNLDNEQAVDASTMRNLISDEVDKKIKNVKAELVKNRQQIARQPAAKNSTRGAPDTPVTTPKKPGKQPPRKNQLGAKKPPPARNGKNKKGLADESANAGSKGKKEGLKKKSTKESNGKKKSSTKNSPK